VPNEGVKPQIDAPLITGGIQVRRSEDGKTAIVEFATETAPVAVKIKAQDGGQLVAVGAHLVGQKIIPVGYEGEVQVIPVSNWSIVGGGENTVLFSFELLRGSALSFSVAATAGLLEALQAALGRSPPEEPKDGWSRDWCLIREWGRSLLERWGRPSSVVAGPDTGRVTAPDNPTQRPAPVDPR